MVTVEIGGRLASIEGGEWVSRDPVLRQSLTQDARARVRPLYDPYPDLTIAQEAIAVYGGQIVEQDPPDQVADRIY